VTPERWHRFAELFESALERAPAERAAFLVEACGEDLVLRRELESVLDSHDRAGDFGESPAFRVVQQRRASTLEPGAHLGRYEIGPLLGAGGIGEVYRARDPQLGRDVAVKILPGRGGVTNDQLARFEHEARAVAALNHPNILAIHDVGVEAGIPYIVSELLEGQTLRARLASGVLPVDDAIDIALQIAAGVTAAHDKGIVHRDLKPENVFVTSEGRIKILDFGLARRTGPLAAAAVTSGTALTDEGLVMGTVGYMSPEQVRGRRADARSDVFALGVLLYEMVTGVRAFAGDSPVETMNAILTAPPGAPGGPRPAVRPAVEVVIHRCLEKDPARRFSSTDEFAAALAAARHTTDAVPRVIHRVVLAVLPFENLSDEADQDYFSDGLTDEMIAQLGRLNPQRLGVIARTSAMRYKQTHKTIDVIGRELGASYVLEGSVRRSADRVRVTAHLIQVSDQTQLWAQAYDGDIGNMLALQSDVARAIAGEIRIQLTPEAQKQLERQHQAPRAAYEAYLKGRYFWNRRTRESLEKSVGYFQNAIDIDPGYAAAYAGLADVYLTQFDYNQMPPGEAFALATGAVLEALRLDDRLAEAHSSLGHLRFHQFEFESAEEEFTRAIELNPGYSTAHYYYGNLLAALGRFDEAIVEVQRALELDPMSPNTRQNRLFIFYLARRYDDAVEQAQETLELDPAYTAIHYWLGLVYERQRKYPEAIRAFETVGPTASNRGLTVLTAIGQTHAIAGNRAEALHVLERLESASTGAYVSSYDLALIHAALGDSDRACALVRKAYDDHSSFLPFLDVDARFDGLRTDPRIQDVLRRMNLRAPSTDTASGKPVEVSRRSPAGSGLWTGRAGRAAVPAAILGAAIAAAGYFGWTRPPDAVGIGGSGRPAVAILGFDNPAGDARLDWLASGVPDMLSIGLAQTAGLDVMSSQRTFQMLREAGQPDTRVDRAQAFEIVRRAGAGAAVAGAVYETSDGFRVDVRVEDLATSRLIAATSVRGPDIFTLADDLVGRLRTAMRVGEQPSGRPIAEITTHSMDAFRLFTEGYAAVRGLRTNDARQALEAALRLDPEYALAHVALSEAFEKFGDQKRAEQHLASAQALAHRLSDRDRLLVEARESHFLGQTDRTVRALESFVARWPDEDTAWDLLVHAYARDPALKMRELDVLHRWRQAVPGPGAGHMYNHFGYAYLDAGRIADAVASFEAYMRVSPNEPNAYDSFGEVLMIAARPADAIRNYEKSLALDPLFGASIAGRSWALAMDGQLDAAVNGVAELEDLGERAGVGWRQVHMLRAFLLSRAGRYRDAASTMERGLQLAGRLPSIGLAVELRLAAASFALETEQLLRARAHARDALRILDRNGALVEPLFEQPVLRSFARFVLGIADVRTGQLASAERHLEAQKVDGRVDDPRQLWWQHALAGEIAFARGDFGGAERLWRTGMPPHKMRFDMRRATAIFANQLPQRDWQARLQRVRGDLTAAAATYRALNSPSPDSPWTTVAEPRFVLERARLLQRMGDTESARAEYSRFLDLWRSADPELPELIEARRGVRH
jgi:serine/threonine protein kinase/tetratricopeptide (TPR) repeat protein